MEKYIELSNCKIFVQDFRPEKEKALLFIHGNSLSSESFNSQMSDDLFSDFRLITFDLPGHGNSCRNEAFYKLDALLNIVIELINELKVNAFILAGNSLGGHIAVQIAEKLNGIKGLFTFGAPPLDIPMPQTAFLPREEFQYSLKKRD